MRSDILERKEEILQWIEQNESKAFICKQLTCKPTTLEGYLKKFGVTYSGNQGAKGKKIASSRKTFFELAKNNFTPSHRLKLRMIADGIKPHKCEECGGAEWRGQPIPIELHHIDGDHYNNNLDNLQLLCPNCHALTDNHAGKANKRKEIIKKQLIIRKIKPTCVICGTATKKGDRKFCSVGCYSKEQEKKNTHIRKVIMVF